MLLYTLGLAAFQLALDGGRDGIFEVGFLENTDSPIGLAQQSQGRVPVLYPRMFLDAPRSGANRGAQSDRKVDKKLYCPRKRRVYPRVFKKAEWIPPGNHASLLNPEMLRLCQLLTLPILFKQCSNKMHDSQVRRGRCCFRRRGTRIQPESANSCDTYETIVRNPRSRELYTAIFGTHHPSLMESSGPFNATPLQISWR